MSGGEGAFSNIIAVTDRKLCDRPFAEQIRRVCSARPAALLLREKDLAPEEYAVLAKEILAICAGYEVPCILHFHSQAAERLKYRKLHLTLDALRGLREAGDHTSYNVLGCSVHSVGEALEAEALGATYLVAGHIYATDCKKGVPPRGIPFLKEVCAAVPLPVYAIGGIRLEGDAEASHTKEPCARQMQEIFCCGAKGACMMSDMMRL